MRWFYELLSLSLSVTPIIILLLCFAPILKKRYSAKWRYILWTVVSVRMLLPFSYANNKPVSVKAPVNGKLISAPVSAMQLPKISPINLHRINNSLGEALFVVYIAGVVIYLAYVILSYIRFRHDILRWGRKTLNDEIHTILKDEKKRLNIKRNIPILISKMVPSPMLIGLIAPTLVLPSEAYSLNELRMILTHELYHLKRNDILIKTIIMAASAVHWFNPAVHFMVKQANKDMEQSCDDFVLNGIDVDGKKFYCSIILKMAALNNNVAAPVFSTNIIKSRKNLETRIKDIFDNSKKKRGIAVLLTVMLLVTISGTIFNFSYAESNQNGNEIINESKSENEFKNNIEKSEFEYDKFENKVPITDNQPNNVPNDDNQPHNVDNELISKNSSAIGGNTQQNESIGSNSSEIQEEIIAGDNIAEIVIVDLNQLENQLIGSNNFDESINQ